MKHNVLSSMFPRRSRIVCSIGWVIMGCWLNVIHTIVALCFTPFLLIPVAGMLIMAFGCTAVYLLLYWLLMRWTASLYPDWKSSLPHLALQLGLFALSMLVAYAMNRDGDFFRPMGVFFGMGEDEWTTLPTYIPTYAKFFAQVVVLQLIAIRFKRFFGCKN